jgi:Uma2 family endonuclease
MNASAADQLPHTYVLRGSVCEGLSDAAFFQLCRDNPDLRIERAADRSVAIMAPTGSFPGFLSGEVFLQLGIWNRQYAQGLVFDSSTGFTMPDQSVLSPDASWIAEDRWAAVAPAQRDRFAPICPDFVAEVQSPSDSLELLQAKMRLWIANGARLAFLISPLTETAWIYRPNGTVSEVTSFAEDLSGENGLPHFRLELHRLRRR